MKHRKLCMISHCSVMTEVLARACYPTAHLWQILGVYDVIVREN
jgi:hypothetical protein